MGYVFQDVHLTSIYLFLTSDCVLRYSLKNQQGILLSTSPFGFAV